MAVSWSKVQRRRVASAVRRYPCALSRCGDLAVYVLPHAVQVDGSAEILEITPVGGERCVIQARADVRPWAWHYTVAVEAHLVDALTGADGMDRSAYLAHCWLDPTLLKIEPVPAGQRLRR